MTVGFYFAHAILNTLDRVFMNADPELWNMRPAVDAMNACAIDTLKLVGGFYCFNLYMHFISTILIYFIYLFIYVSFACLFVYLFVYLSFII